VFLRKAYSMLLGLYPMEFQVQFGGEMLAVFQQASAEHRESGCVNLMLFALREMFGLVAGAARARLSNTGASGESGDLPLPSDIGSAEKYIDLMSRRVIRAISTHDFPKARIYDAQDRRARALLARLRAQPQ
jgi:hypothetical protein